MSKIKRLTGGRKPWMAARERMAHASSREGIHVHPAGPPHLPRTPGTPAPEEPRAGRGAPCPRTGATRAETSSKAHATDGWRSRSWRWPAGGRTAQAVGKAERPVGGGPGRGGGRVDVGQPGPRGQTALASLVPWDPGRSRTRLQAPQGFRRQHRLQPGLRKPQALLSRG